MENKSGIYKITCLVNNKIYVGSAVNLSKRKNDHFETLSKNIHKNRHLQNAFKKHGNDNFVFEILEIVEDKKELIVREQYWIDKTKCFDNKIGFNICQLAGSALGVKHSEATRKKRSLLNKGNKFNLGKKASEETLQKLSAAQKGNKSSVGRVLTEETKNKISKSNKGRISPTLGLKYSEESRKKMSEARIGKKLSEETKNKMRVAKTGIVMSEATKEKISKSNTGVLNPFYGKKHSLETKEKFKKRKGMSGRKHSEETKQKIRESKLSPKKNFLTG